MKKEDATPGTRVQLHPATDLWMRGARFGSIVAVRGEVATVKLDALHEPQRIHLRNLLDVRGVQA